MSQTSVHSIQVGTPRDYGVEGAPDPMDQPWTSAIVKTAVTGRIWLGTLGLDGDQVANTQGHGGPEQAALLYSDDHYPMWREELGLDMQPGGFGENLTISGLSEETVCVGDVYAIGDARVQVTKPRTPCWKLERRWRQPDLVALVVANGRSGWYVRVLREGFVEAGMSVELIERPADAVTISAVQAAKRAGG